MIRAPCFRWFDNVILFAIIVNCLFLALDEPQQLACCDLEGEKDSFVQFCTKRRWTCNEHRRNVLVISEFFFTIIFIIECLVRIVAYGLVTYLQSGWCVRVLSLSCAQPPLFLGTCWTL